MRWLVYLAGILMACSGTGREGLNTDSNGVADGIVGKADSVGEVAGIDAPAGVDAMADSVDGGLVDLGCVD